MPRAANFQPTLAWNTSTIFLVFEFLQVKWNVRALHEVLGFQLQPGGCVSEGQELLKVGRQLGFNHHHESREKTMQCVLDRMLLLA